MDKIRSEIREYRDLLNAKIRKNFHSRFHFVQIEFTTNNQAFPEGRLSGDGVAVLRFPDGLLATAPDPPACSSRGAWPINCLNLI